MNILGFVLTGFLLLFCSLAKGMSEKSLNEVILDSYWKRTSLNVIENKEFKIAYKHFQQSCFEAKASDKCEPKKAAHLIFLLPGRTEPMAKYTETIVDLMKMGFDVLVLDHRGQGESSRIVKDRDVGHIESFNDYVEDAKLVLEQFGKDYKGIYGLGVSMGSIVLEHLLFELKNSDIPMEKAIFVAPMLAIDTSPYPNSVAYALVTSLSTIGRGQSYATGTGPWIDQIYDNTSSSKIRKVLGHSWTKKSSIQRVGGPSNRWVKEAMSAGVRARKRAEQFSYPLLVLSTEIDEYVQADKYAPYCASVPKCREVNLKGSRHEILQEVDAIRNKAFEAIKKFLAKG